MAVVLVGFLGKGSIQNRDDSGRPKYARVQYNFSEAGQPPAVQGASIFSVALQRHLKERGTPVDKWLIIGTKDSFWSALGDAITDWPDEAVETSVRLEDAVANGTLTQSLLDEWSGVLKQHNNGLATRCQLADTAENDAGQRAIWQALHSIIEPEDEIVFDVTYGLRHQPIVAAFSLMLLRWSHKITKMSLFYGARELQGSQPYCPVVCVDFCRELVAACEAIASYEETGHYEPLGKLLKMPGDFDQQLSEVAFADEVNRPKQEEAGKLKGRLQAADKQGKLQAPAQVLVPRLESALDLATEPRVDRKFYEKAVVAHGKKQHFKAVAYLYEAILMAWMYCQNPRRQEREYITFGARKKAKQKLEEEDSFADSSEFTLFMKITYLRNGVLHGTRSTHEQWAVEDEIEDERRFVDLFEKGCHLYKKVANITPFPGTGSRPTQVP